MERPVAFDCDIGDVWGGCRFDGRGWGRRAAARDEEDGDGKHKGRSSPHRPTSSSEPDPAGAGTPSAEHTIRLRNA